MFEQLVRNSGLWEAEMKERDRLLYGLMPEEIKIVEEESSR
jgi:hypothetical protein